MTNDDECGSKNEKRSHRYEINRPWARHAQKCTKYEMCLSIIMITCTVQHLKVQVKRKLSNARLD